MIDDKRYGEECQNFQDPPLRLVCGEHRDIEEEIANRILSDISEETSLAGSLLSIDDFDAMNKNPKDVSQCLYVLVYVNLKQSFFFLHYLSNEVFLALTVTYSNTKRKIEFFLN